MAAEASGDANGALEELEGLQGQFSLNQVRDSPFMGRAFANRVAARALRQLGRDDEAIERLGSTVFFPWNMAESHFLRAEIHESQGNVAAALDQYDRFLELWEAADPEFQPLVQDVRSRMARLAGERGGR